MQVGVNTPGSTQTVAYALALVLAKDPEMVFVSVDTASAFIRYHWAAMFAAVQQSDLALLPMVQWVCADETPLRIKGPKGDSVMTKCQGTHACVAAVRQWRWCDSIGLLWFATVDDDHCDRLSLRH